MIGPGKYDDVCTFIRELSKAKGVVIIITDGERGSGFSVQGTLEFTLKLPEALRIIADDVEKGHKEGRL